MEAVRPGRKTNLPHTLTPFIGRQQEVADIRGLLTGRRLITLTGPGGSGKTRLALEVARGLESEFPDGVWMAELAELSEPALVPQAVAAALGVRETPGQDGVEVLTSFLYGRHVLLFLDNCEHLLDACAHLLAVLLQSCPDLHLLTTSRQALGLAGEIVRPLLPLAVPKSHDALDPATLPEVEAVALFLDRAAALTPDFALTETNAAGVVQICRLLDGIPLAIELAAARVPVLSVAQIAARLHDTLPLLAAGPRLGTARHQTMRAAIDWSYALLPAAEQKLWRRLSVFRGTFSLASAAAVCGDRMGENSQELLDLMTQLVRKSLVVAVRGEGEVRYRLLEPLRQYAAEQLAADGETVVFSRRHFDYYLAWTEQHDRQLRGPEQAAWLAQFDARYANLRASLAWSLREPQDAQMVLRLAVALAWFWVARNMFAEGRRWLKEALARPGAETPGPARQHALMFAGIQAWFQTDYTASRRYIEECHALALSLEEDDGRWGIPYILMMLGQVLRFQGEGKAALRYLSESVAEFRRRNEPWGLALALNCFGSVCRQAGDMHAAYAAFHESLPIWYAVGDPWGIALNRLEFFLQAAAEKDHETAAALYRESEGAFEALGLAWHLSHMTLALGDMALQRGDYAFAVEQYRNCEALSRQIGARSGEGAALMGSGVAALGQGRLADGITRCQEGMRLLEPEQRPHRVAYYLECAGAVVEAAGHAVPAARLRTAVDALRNAGQPAAAEDLASLFATALAALQELILELTAVTRQPPEAAASRFDLTPRELEVLRLLTQGLTDPQIAGRLVISRRTVNAHVRSIYDKLGVSSRTAATRLVLEQDLFVD